MRARSGSARDALNANDGSPDAPSRGLILFAAILYGAGLFARVWPFFDRPLMYLERFPTEDGYFMLTIGRNLAIGKGFSTADGTILTNGTQPLTTLLWAACFWLTGGSRELGVLVVLLLELAFSIAAAYALYRLGRLVFAGRSFERSASQLASALWFASPVMLSHSMNCLESGAYALAVMACAHELVRLETAAPGPGWRRVVGFGLLLGVTFWTRNDAVFLIAAACAAHLTVALQRREELRARLLRCVVFGGVSVLVAAPWLIYNYVGFGSIMPVSGRAERLTGHLGSNIPSTLTSLLEYASVTLQIPQMIQDDWRIAVLGALVLLGLGALIARDLPRTRQHERVLLAFVVVFGALLSSYYAIFFGAKWFVQRYLFPLSPFFTLLFAVEVLRGLKSLSPQPRKLLAPAAGVVLLVVMIGLHVRTAVLYRHHPHFQVVRWVKKNVPETTWVGAIQTGTLGFFHDRTLNFDGKVNPYAYQAAIEHRRPEYVVSTNVQYLADWSSIAEWLDDEPIRQNFDLLIRDEEQQLGVLVRKTLSPQAVRSDR
jgi:hypothetical protein